MQSGAVSYLYTLATVSITFVGFSALVLILRQTLGGEMSNLDILIARIFIQLGFIVSAGSLIPPLLLLNHLSDDIVWRASSLATAIPTFLFASTYPSRRRAASGVKTPSSVWVDVVIALLLSVWLLCNAAGVIVVPSSGPYVAALTGILFLAGWAYLQALNTVLRHHRLRRVAEHGGNRAT
jgi:hypothetical protein